MIFFSVQQLFSLLLPQYKSVVSRPFLVRLTAQHSTFLFLREPEVKFLKQWQRQLSRIPFSNEGARVPRYRNTNV